jgi:GntR family transcriptional regulator
MIPFRLTLKPGVPINEQVTYAAKKAMLAGQLRSGEAFPSVRALSRELKISPATAHKVVAQLLAEGLLEVVPGVGTMVCAPPSATAVERKRWLREELERFVVAAKQLGLQCDDVVCALNEHWTRLNPDDGGSGNE